MTPEYAKARRHLARRDQQLQRIIRAVGPCTLKPDPDGFRVLVRSIVAQQISTKAARSISAKLETVLGAFRPKNILQTSEADLRSAGLSANKLRSLLDLAQKCAEGTVAIKKFPGMEDEEIIAQLLPVRGIGRWTAEMFLIFSLGRTDVLPCADYGLRAGIQREYGLSELPGKGILTELAEPWRPYRSIATWFVWRSLGSVPQSE